MADVGLVGLAVALTLVAGLGLSGYEKLAAHRGWRWRELHRPGGAALLIGAGLTAALAGLVRGNQFIGVAFAVAAVSGASILRRNGRLLSFVYLWVGATAVVVALNAEVAAFGARPADVVFTAFLLAAFCSLLREWDASAAYGWAAALLTAGAMTALCYALERHRDARLGLLVTGAVFGVISVAPFGAALLGRTGARFVGLVIGGMAIRAAAGTPLATLVVVAIAAVCVVLWVGSLPRHLRARVGWSFAGLAVALGVCSVPALVELRKAARPISATVAKSRGLVRVDPQGGLATAAARLAPIQAAFNRHATKLEKRPVQLARVVPFLSANVRAATVGARSAANLAGSARALLNTVNVRAVSPRDGAVDRQALRNLNGGLLTVRDVIGDARADIDAGGDLDLLVPRLRDAVRDLHRQLDRVADRVDTTIDGTVVAERLLGFDRPRRFFIAMQNNAESRATGGYIANYGVVTMRDGRVASRTFSRTSEFDDPGAPPRQLNAPLDYRRRYSKFDVDRAWTNVNLSPDYPTVAKVIADQYRQFSGRKVDGVFTLDPIGLAGLLKLTGPVRVASWPVPLNDRNIVAITLHDQYRAFENNTAARIDFLGEVGQAVFDRLVQTGLSDVLRAAPVIDNLISTRRLQLWSSDTKADRFFAKTKSDGAVAPLRGDAIVVTTQNAGANKTDWFLRRTLDYDARVSRTGDGVAVDATLRVRLTNGAPTSAEPRYVIGPNAPGIEAGLNRTFFSFYTPLRVDSASIDGEPLVLDGAPELGVFAHSAFVDIPSGRSRTIEVHLVGVIPKTDRYRLRVFAQPTITPDALGVSVNGVGARGTFSYAGALVHDIDLAWRVDE